MNLEEAIVAHLLASSTIRALVGDRVQADELDENSVMPAIAFRQVSRSGVGSMSGASGLAQVRVEFECWDKKRTVARRIAEALRGLLDGFSGALGGSGIHVSPCTMEDQASVNEPDLRLRGVQMQFSFWINESVGL